MIDFASSAYSIGILGVFTPTECEDTKSAELIISHSLPFRRLLLLELEKSVFRTTQPCGRMEFAQIS